MFLSLVPSCGQIHKKYELWPSTECWVATKSISILKNFQKIFSFVEFPQIFVKISSHFNIFTINWSKFSKIFLKIYKSFFQLLWLFFKFFGKFYQFFLKMFPKYWSRWFMYFWPFSVCIYLKILKNSYRISLQNYSSCRYSEF